MALDIGKISLISDGLSRTGIRKDGKGSYFAMSAYIDFGGLYPLPLEIFVNSEQEVLPKGSYVVPVSMRLYNGRLYHDLELKRAVLVKTIAQTAQTNGVTPSTTAKAN